LKNCELRLGLAELLQDLAGMLRVHVYAYCFMPDHVHLVAAARGEVDLVGVVQRFKSVSTRLYWQHGGKGKLWQRGFYDHVVRNEENLRQLARYVLANPVRAGMVEDFRDYVGCGSYMYELQELQ